MCACAKLPKLGFFSVSMARSLLHDQLQDLRKVGSKPGFSLSPFALEELADLEDRRRQASHELESSTALHLNARTRLARHGQGYC